MPSGVIKLLHVREQTTDWLIGNCKEHKKLESHLSAAAAAIACCQFEDGKDGELWGKKWIHAREVNHQLSQGFPPRICAVYLRLNFQDPPKYQLTLQSWLFSSWMIDLLCIKTLSELRAEVKQHFCFFSKLLFKVIHSLRDRGVFVPRYSSFFLRWLDLSNAFFYVMEVLIVN